jgi:hypothetical protein
MACSHAAQASGPVRGERPQPVDDHSAGSNDDEVPTSFTTLNGIVHVRGDGASLHVSYRMFPCPVQYGVPTVS